MRLFICIDIPEEIRERLWNAAGKLDVSGASIAKRENYHITLQFLDETPESKLHGIKEAVSSIRQSRFTISISGVSSFNGRLGVIFADVAAGSGELVSLYSRIGEELRKRNIDYEKGEYKPHVTLARARLVKDRELLLSSVERISRTSFGSFVAESLFLKSSRPGQGGHAHEPVFEKKFS